MTFFRLDQLGWGEKNGTIQEKRGGNPVLKSEEKAVSVGVQ